MKTKEKDVTITAEEKPVVSDVIESIDKLVSKAQSALDAFSLFNQEQIDKIVKAMSEAGQREHLTLARAAVEETGRGVFEDKVTKNIFATEYVYHSIKDAKTVGVVDSNAYEDYEEIAEPVGVICAVTPVTNPTSTVMFKILISIKTRNPVIFAFHPSAQKCSEMAASTMYKAALAAGAPKNCIQWVTNPSIEATSYLMNHAGVAMVLATGGSGMVRSAYSTGKPALGVGPGNVPCYIHKSANVERASTDLMMSKTFDNGMICASEQSVIVDREISERFEAFMKDNACVFLTEEETEKLSSVVIKPGPHPSIVSAIVGQPAYDIAKLAGLDVPRNTKILLARVKGVGPEFPLSAEKLSPILTYYIADSADEGISIAEKVIEYGGLGHSAVIHSEDEAVIDRYTARLKASRLIINSPSSHGAIGDIYNTNMPSLTLGCGSYGKNSTSSNVSAVNLVNKKRVAQRRANMQWFKIPEKIYFEFDSTQYLEKMPDITKAFIVTDPAMVSLGYIDKVLYYLRKRKDYVHCEIFSDVEPDPDIQTVYRGVEAMRDFKPDVIIALGGGSAMDAAKGMWMFYENPELDFSSLTMRFMDIRKKIVKFPRLGRKAKLVAIPTTSGTGSEVTSFAVISDKSTGTKYPLADYELTPDVAILDPDFVMSVPAKVTADTGMDVLTHAIEAYVSTFASDYTDALALHAIKLVFENLEEAYHNPGNKKARERMHNASCMAGMSFSNAFLGINHSIAHKLGGEFHIPHGRANAILLPFVIEYNAQKPTKFVSFPKYETYIADKRYAEIAKHIGLTFTTTQDGVIALVAAIRSLTQRLDIPAKVSENNILKDEYFRQIDKLAEMAFADQCTGTNPRAPLVSEIKEILEKIY